MASEPFITIQHLSHAFGTGALRKEVLRDVSVDFYPGEIVIIMGPSGSGKTTLLTLVGALRSVQQGSIRIGGTELSGAGSDTIIGVRRRIGFIFQGHNLIPSITACENVQLALSVDPEATAAHSRRLAIEFMGMVGLAGQEHKKPDELSGGQKQRVAIARALIRRPDIIMADEPTAALDRKTGREVVELLQQLSRREGVAILLVTHDNRILDIADRIITLDDGRIEETHRGMERLSAAVTDLVALLPRYTAAVPIGATTDAGEALAALRHRFAELLEPLISRVADFAARKMAPPLMAQARSLEKQLHDLALAEGTLGQLMALFAAPPSERIRHLSDTFFQPLEFLLFTVAEAAQISTDAEIDLVLALTEDRGDLMTALREKFFTSETGLDQAERDFLFNMTELFAREVYLIREWAGSCRIWLDGEVTRQQSVPP